MQLPFCRNVTETLQVETCFMVTAHPYYYTFTYRLTFYTLSTIFSYFVIVSTVVAKCIWQRSCATRTAYSKSATFTSYLSFSQSLFLLCFTVLATCERRTLYVVHSVYASDVHVVFVCDSV